MWVELEATTWGEYHNRPETISPKKEIRNSKTATHKRCFECKREPQPVLGVWAPAARAAALDSGEVD